MAATGALPARESLHPADHRSGAGEPCQPRPAGEGADGATGFSVGAWLAAERARRGLSLEQVEAATRIRRRALERLEAGSFDGRCDAFARSFVRTVSGALGADASHALRQMQEGVAAPTSAAAPASRVARAGRVLAIGLAASLGLALVAGLGFGMARLGPELAGFWRASPAEERVRRDFVRELAQAVRMLPPPPAVSSVVAPGPWAEPPPGVPPFDPFITAELEPPQAPPEVGLQESARARAARRAWLRRLGGPDRARAVAGPARVPPAS